MQRTNNDDYRNRGKCNEAPTGDQTDGTRACPKEHRASTWHLLLMWCRSWRPQRLCLFCCGGWSQCEMQCLPQLLRRGGKPCNHVWFSSPLRQLVLLNTLEVCVFVCVSNTFFYRGSGKRGKKVASRVNNAYNWHELFEFLTTARHETCLCSNDEFKFVKSVG